MSVKDANHAYATRRALNLIHELFLLIRETYPQYLVEQFGVSDE